MVRFIVRTRTAVREFHTLFRGAIVVTCFDAYKSSAVPRSTPRGIRSTQTRSYSAFNNDNANANKQLSSRKLADLEDVLYQTVGTVEDPCLGVSLASLQWLQKRLTVNHTDGSTLQLFVKLPSLMHPDLVGLKRIVQERANQELEQWLETNHVPGRFTIAVQAIAGKPMSMMAKLMEDADELLERLGPGLSGVTHFLAVYSCKGGVGKSTIAVNLAYELAHMGGRVGLVDLDVYGPSLPLLVRPDDIGVRRSPLGSGMVYPIEHKGVKLLSLGFVNTSSGVPGSGHKNGAAVMRGPFAGTVVSQLLKGTDWGELDVLILDLPPGTGDVQLQVLQDLQISGAVAVSTPSRLAVVDTEKGVELFTSLGVPTLAVVENMAYFECEGGGIHYPFGRGLLADKESKLASLSSENIVQLPISETANAANDSGKPICLVRNDAAIAELASFGKLSKIVAGELLKLQFGKADSQTVVRFNKVPGEFDAATVHISLERGSDAFTVRLFGKHGAIQRRVPAVGLRARDPKIGTIMEDSPFKDQVEDSFDANDPVVTIHKAAGKMSPSIVPNKVDKRGRYGFAVQWADGATIIYSNQSIAVAAGAEVVGN